MYRDDLAWIHHVGFAEFAESAAPWIVETLRARRARSIVELGCGSGVLARELTLAGFEVLGFDASPSMIELARQTAPDARFTVARYDEATLPSCDAVIAMGEVLNYGGMSAARRLIASVPAPFLLFDVAEGGSYPAHEELRLGGTGWSVIVIKDSDGTTLTRRVLTFRETGSRDDETHRLELFDRDELLTALRAAGFRTRIRRSYGPRRLPRGHAVFVAERRA